MQSHMLLLLISSLPMMWASSQKVVTGFNCETSGNDREWWYTTYGRNGGINGGYGSIEGRLFEFDCQSKLCFDSEHERNHYWVTCGFSWKEVRDLDDSDMVITDVRTWAHDGAGRCYGGYKAALRFDSVGQDAFDTQGNEGHLGFWFCYLEQSWKDVKRTQKKEVVVDMVALAATVHAPDFGYTRIARWDTHNAGTALAYGDMARTSGLMRLWIKKGQVKVPKKDVKVIGSWTFKPVSRRSYDVEHTITKSAEFSRGDEMTTSDLNAWEKEISQSHSVEVAVQADVSYGAMSASAETAYGYEYGHKRNQRFESQLQNLASSTFSQNTEISRTFTVPKQVHGEPLHARIWFFETEVINSDYEKATHFYLEYGFERSGCGFHIAPNCLPGYFAPHSPNGWTCSEDWAIIDPTFTPPPECGGIGEGCDWVPVPASECPREDESIVMHDCNEAMEHGELCEADSILPNGKKDFDINNCGAYDIFRFTCPHL